MADQIWKNAYIEIAQRFTDNLTNVQWVDLWHNQVGFLIEEHPFPTPAVFLAFRSLDIDDMAELVQQVEFQLDVYFFYETFLDTYQDAFNQSDALDYLNTMSEIYSLLHGYSGDSFSELRRTGFRQVDTGNAGNLYMQSFVGVLHDEVAKRMFEEASENVDLGIEKGLEIKLPDDDFIIP